MSAVGSRLNAAALKAIDVVSGLGLVVFGGVLATRTLTSPTSSQGIPHHLGSAAVTAPSGSLATPGWPLSRVRRTFSYMSTHNAALPVTRPDGTPYPSVKSEVEWQAELSPSEYHVLREAGTERPYVGEYTDTKTQGIYSCRACNAELFTSETKFDSHCGWPSFWSPLAGDSVVEIEDHSLGMKRVEIRCANCGSHLGHVFEGEKYGNPQDLRYCINSISLKLHETN